MTHETRTSDQIEADIRAERAAMSRSINSLQEKFSLDAIVSDVGAMFRGQGGDIGRAVSRTVGRNPAAVALVGVGLAWMFLGQNRPDSDRDTSGYGPRDQWQDPGHSPRARGWQSDTPGRSAEEHHLDRDRYWYGSDRMMRVRNSPGRGLDEDRTRSGQGAAAMAASVSDSLQGAASAVSHTASDMADRLSHGLEDLSQDARERVIAARRAAHDAREASAAAMQKGSRAAAGFFDDQPLVVGALAVAFGAALGGVLPHSQIEDDTLGDSSDRLFADAQTLFYRERDRAMAAARTAVTDVQDELREAGSDLADLMPEGKTVGAAIVDRAADAAGRVIHRAAGDVDHAPDRNPPRG